MIPIVGISVAALAALGGVIAYSQLRRSPGNHFDSNGVPIFYSERGSGEPVILVHGFGAQGDTNFRNPGTVAAFAKKYRVINMDARGHGLSGKPHDAKKYGLEAVEDIRRLMDHLGIERAHLVGYSMGALLTLKFMALYPERLITAAPCGNGWHIEGDPQVAVAEQLAADLAAGRGYRALFKLIEPLNGPVNPLLQHGMHLYFRMANDQQALAAMVQSWRAELKMTAEDLESLTLPSLTVIGEHDAFVHGARRLADTKPNHELVLLKNRNHYNAFHRDFTRNVLAFLEKHPAAAPAAVAAK